MSHTHPHRRNQASKLIEGLALAFGAGCVGAAMAIVANLAASWVLG